MRLATCAMVLIQLLPSQFQTLESTSQTTELLYFIQFKKNELRIDSTLSTL